MNIGKVIGTIVATRKDPKLEGSTLLLVQNAEVTGETKAGVCVCVDGVGAGVGELVLYCQGSSARQTDSTQNRPVDAVIMAIVDEIEMGHELTYRKC